MQQINAQTLFRAGEIRAICLTLDDAATLQLLFDENPDYFLAVSGQVARPDAAKEQLAGDVPEEFSYTRQLAIGFIDAAGRLIAVADLVSDLLAPGVWHIGLFMVASDQRRQGLGSRLYEALENWVEAAGARWIRLGVVIGNNVAERFWNARQFNQMMVRHDVLMEGKLNDVRVMVKPLGDNQLSEYRTLVGRDQPAPG